MNGIDDKRGTALVCWPQTGLEAPFLFTAAGIEYERMPDQRVAFTANLVHPDLDIVGTIRNAGTGGPTWFKAADHNRFSDLDLEWFATQCRLGGEPLPGAEPIAILLGLVLDETEAEIVTALKAATMRTLDGLMIRTFTPYHTETAGTPDCGEVLLLKNWLTAGMAPRNRPVIAEGLELEPRYRRPDDAIWQMFNGRRWVPLLPESDHPLEIPALELAMIAQVYDKAKAATGTSRVRSAGPMDGFYVSDSREPSQRLLLDDTAGTAQLDTWCRCTPAKPAVTRFQHWDVRKGLLGTGTVHAARRCRRVVTID
ncbi:hypothetical protein ALI22I_20365 [Saccharothrix sp. ALI-22-I]|uniref:hypothetical protein n=1 Tax=Saccharothrix sp. ALI-22-I TaxID=1933778 RepID=UPI00097CAA4E|nr:hypothetical protein [Saccharothrix sp. ALI-22-I]ONI88095.1 hypothetical protein ALI22I_20365 [Saccharothrix sp. ALI-22-I]